MHARPPPVAVDPPEPVARVPARWKRLAVLTAAALLLHVATVGGLQWTWPELDRAPLAAVQLRVVDQAAQGPQPAELESAVDAAPPVLPAGRPAAMPAARRAVVAPASHIERAMPGAPRAIAGAPLPLPDSVPEPGELQETRATRSPGTLLALATSSETSAAAGSAPVAVDEPIPRYRTRPPPPMLLRYDLTRGNLSGNGELTWRPQGDHYELMLQGKVGSLAVLTQTSSGGFDAAGLAPVRFTDKRLTRAATAVNFQRDAGKITFSGPSTEYPLREGTQDRVSWMIQLASIISAEPRLRTAGAKVAMMVVGSHGDASAWVFRSSGPEVVQTASGPVDTVKFVREPRDPNDTTVQVWLDPRRNDLPVRAVQQSGARDEPFELRVLSIVPAP